MIPARRHARSRPAAIATAGRAAPGTVGFLGDSGSLIELFADDPLTGTVFEGVATWDTGNLLVTSGGVEADGYYIHAPVVHTGGTDFTIRNSIIEAPGGVGLWGVSAVGDDRGTLLIEDCTVICGTSGTTVYVNGVSSDSRLIIRRCDVSGSGDGIHAVGQPGSSYDDGSIVYWCYVHDLSFLDSGQHVDGIQFFNNYSGVGPGPDTYAICEGNYVTGVLGPVNEPINSSMTSGRAPGEGDNPPYLQLKCHNNYMQDGVYHARFGFALRNTECTSNDLNELHTDEVGLATVDLQGIPEVWTNNVDAAGDDVPHPFP